MTHELQTSRTLVRIRQPQANRVNLLEQTSLRPPLSRWDILTGSFSESGTQGNRRISINKAQHQATYVDVLQQTLSSPLVAGRIYTLSFDVQNPTTTELYFETIAYTPDAGGDKFKQYRLGYMGRFERLTFTFEALRNYTRIVFRLHSGHILLSSPKLEEGAEATAWQSSEGDKKGERGEAGLRGIRGAVLRGSQIWDEVAEGFEFEAGNEGETYQDIVLHEGQYYYCTLGHLKSMEFKPSPTSSFWKLGTRLEFVAAKLLLAERSKIRNLIVDELTAEEEKGDGVYTHIRPGLFEVGYFDEEENIEGIRMRTRRPSFRFAQTSKGAALQFWEGGELVGEIGAEFMRNTYVSSFFAPIIVAPLVDTLSSLNDVGQEQEIHANPKRFLHMAFADRRNWLRWRSGWKWEKRYGTDELHKIYHNDFEGVPNYSLTEAYPMGQVVMDSTRTMPPVGFYAVLKRYHYAGVKEVDIWEVKNWQSSEYITTLRTEELSSAQVDLGLFQMVYLPDEVND